MKQEKETRQRVIPYERFEIDAIEAWLEEKAREGWALVNMGGICAYFKKAAPANTRYRIVVNPTGAQRTVTELRDACAESGWHYVLHRNRYDTIYRTDDVNAPELTDSAALRNAAGSIRYEYRAVASILFAIVLFVLFMQHLGPAGVFDGPERSVYDLLNGTLAALFFYGLLALLRLTPRLCLAPMKRLLES